MKEQFVTYEIALKLKELGFDEICFGYFDENKELLLSSPSHDGRFIPRFYKNSNASKWLTSIFSIFSSKKFNICTAPLWQQAIDWFRDKYKMHIVIQQTWYNNYQDVAYFFFIEGSKFKELIYDYQDLYDKILDTSEQDIPGNYINNELYDKNIFELGFAYKTYKECQEKAILKCIEIYQNKNKILCV